MLDFQRTGSDLVQAGDLQWRYLWGPAVDQILAEEAVDNGADETVQWTLTDHLNTVRDIAKYDPAMDSTTIVNHLVYDAFGQVTSETIPAVDSLFLFTARPFDTDTQPQNNVNRWYDPAVGRWLCEDPIGFEETAVLMADLPANLYSYVLNSPCLRTDPYGLFPTGPCTISIWAGDTLYESKDLKDFIQSQLVPPSKENEVCPSRYFSVLGCGKYIPTQIPENQAIPGAFVPKETMPAAEMVTALEQTLRAARSLTATLCENRKKFCDDDKPERYKCGSENQRCDSVKITVKYGSLVTRMLSRGIGPNGGRVPGLPNAASRALLKELHRLSRLGDTAHCLTDFSEE